MTTDIRSNTVVSPDIPRKEISIFTLIRCQQTLCGSPGHSSRVLKPVVNVDWRYVEINRRVSPLIYSEYR
jgi:hypothetical protein